MVAATPEALRAAHDALDLHDPLVQIAHLSFDSFVDDQPDCLPRRLVFESQGTLIRVIVDHRAEESWVAFEVEPPRCSEVRVLQPHSLLVTQTDAAGRAKVALQPGLTCLIFGATALIEGAVRTGWVVF